MNTFLAVVLPSLLGFVYYLIYLERIREPGRVLQRNFAKLGVLTGRTLVEIINVCGYPQSVSYTVDEDGEPAKIIQWVASGYHIVLLFDEEDICQGVSCETSVAI
ncbi:MAG: hypothetical protein KBS47_07965 [Bacteroidales bacterium]|nr:hypothetical protein [Candidatus Equimonas enterica]